MVKAAERIRVTLADDHPVFREGLAKVITERPELELAGEASDVREAIDLVEKERPDVAVFDMRFGNDELDGLGALEALTQRGVEVPVMFLSAHTTQELVTEAIVAGARGYYPKESGRREICDNIIGVSRGEIRVHPDLQTFVFEGLRKASTELQEPEAFTKREIEVLTLLAEGKQNAEIAKALHLAPATISGHVMKVFGKLGVKNRAAATREAMRRGLIK